MPEPRDEDLILYFYGELSERRADGVRQQLDSSPEVRQRYDAICQTLQLVEDQPVPEPYEDYGNRVWRRLQPELDRRPASWLRRWLDALIGLWRPRLMAGVAVAALVAIAFTAGRYWPAVDGVGQGVSPAGRERILLVAVGEHLERSEMLLIELANAPRDGSLDLSRELQLAEELLPANRLYRQAASRAEQAGIAEVLDDLERLLLDIAHSPELAGDDLDQLQRRILDSDTLFRVQVIGSRVQHTDSTINPAPSPLGEV
ncbi:MAG: hypothetical protein AAF560_07135 [Acidobacteriota bacterium]